MTHMLLMTERINRYNILETNGKKGVTVYFKVLQWHLLKTVKTLVRIARALRKTRIGCLPNRSQKC